MLFRGNQYNKYFAAFINTIVPVIGSAPAIIIASSYERKIEGRFIKIDEYILRVATIALQLITVFLLFGSFFESQSIYATGINLIFGLDVADITVFSPSYFLVFLLALPFVSAVLSCLYFKNNIHNVVSYIVSLICAITVFVIAVFSDNSAGLRDTPLLWIYCILNVLIMLLSVFSIIKVRNRFLLSLDAEKKESAEVEEINMIQPQNDSQPTLNIPVGTYKCAKCGKYIPKGTICECRCNNMNTLDRLMTEQNKKETSDFCVYCRKALKPGETCNCIGDGFGITVKPEQFDGRKCKYCGEILVGDSICVCEKIMKNSKPASPQCETTEPKKYFEAETFAASSRISDEMAELEKKIEEKFSKVKSSLSSNDNT